VILPYAFGKIHNRGPSAAMAMTGPLFGLAILAAKGGAAWELEDPGAYPSALKESVQLFS
jgi:hypothetical protein